MNKLLTVVIVVAVAVAGVYYGLTRNKDDSPTNTYSPPIGTVTQTGTKMETGTEVKIASNSTLGNILVDGTGKTLYMFMKDGLNKTNCYGQCESNWPPLLTATEPVSGSGISSTLLKTITRQDGNQQVVYNGKPLYYWLNDENSGDTKGQNVGKVWYVVSPDGAPIQNSAIVMVTTSPLGKILSDGNGWGLYMFTIDTTNTSKCYGDCAIKWPPLLTIGDPTPGPGVNTALISTTVRSDGSKQVTYNKLPLYYWWKDAKPGDTTGQKVGNVWYVLSPAGIPIK